MAIATLLATLSLAVPAAGERSIPDGELLHQAQSAFHAGMEVRSKPTRARSIFLEAASSYEELRQRGAHNADLYRDQGNAYLLAGDLPRAILAYRRGLRLAPADPLLRSNLTYARGQVVYPGQEEFGRPAENLLSWLPYWPLRLRLMLFFCSYSLGWFGIVRWWMVGRAALLTLGLIAFGLAIFLATSLGTEAWYERQESLRPLVVIGADAVPVRKGNGALYPPRYQTPLYRGVEARLRCERGDWLQIELAGGQAGWVPRAAALCDTR